MQSKEIVLLDLYADVKARLGIEKAASNVPSDALYKNMVAHLDELLDSQLNSATNRIIAYLGRHKRLMNIILTNF